MKLFIFIFLFLPIYSDASDPGEAERINRYLCIGARAEYQKCQKSGLSNCIKSMEERYRKLSCEKRLSVKINQATDKFKEQKFEWSETCKTVKNEFKYCDKEKIKNCVKSMRKRYANLWCEMALESKIDAK